MQRLEDSKMMDDTEIELLRGPGKLIYLPPTMAGLISTRTTKTYTFQNQVNTWGGTAFINVNSGPDYLWGPNCFLKLEWTVPASANAAYMSFGAGSIMNVINEIIFTHSSGEVLEQYKYVNQQAAIRTRWNTSADDQVKLNALLGGITPYANAATDTILAGGFNSDQDTVELGKCSVVNIKAADAAKTYVSMIPLSYLLGIFNRRDQMIPPSLIAGATMQINFAPQSESTSYADNPGAAIFAATTFKPTLIFDSCRVFDDVQRAILQESASLSGLQFCYETFFASRQSFPGANVDFNVQYAASLTSNVSAVATPTNLPNEGANAFTMLGALTQFQWRIASDYKPQQPVTIADLDHPAEAYHYALQTWEAGLHEYDVVDCPTSGSNVTLTQFKSLAGLYGTTLERSPVGLQLTGLPTNNSSLLNFSATKAGEHNITIFLKYLRVVDCRGGNATVSR